MTDPRYKALLIGCGRYERDPHKLLALTGPANDLRLMGEALTHPKSGLFAAERVRTLLDPARDEMLEAIEIFFNDAGPEDHLLFYYSGHGCTDTQECLYLCARNTRTDLLGSSAVPDREINSMAAKSRARKYIFVLDCCHSGGFKGGTSGLALSQGSGRCLITSCAGHQLSRDAATPSGASLFTHHLAEALTSGEVDGDGDGVVLTSEIFKYVQPRVYAASLQTVQWTMDKSFGEAAIARAERQRRPEAREPAAPAAEGAAERVPGFKLSESSIEHRDVLPGEGLPVERIDVSPTGEEGGEWTFECSEDWVRIERRGNSLFVTLDTTRPGARRGWIVVRDRTGVRKVRVLLHVLEAEAPRLAVAPAELDFGVGPRGNTGRLEVRVTNTGPGRLNWRIESTPAGLVVNRGENGLVVEVAPGFVGELRGEVHLASNGGSASVAVRGTVTPPLPEVQRVAPPPPPPLEPVDPLALALEGWWMNDAGALRIRTTKGAGVFSDHNLLGVQVGQGRVQLQGGVAWLQGNNALIGDYTAQVTVQGAMLTGQIRNALGQVFPIMFMRQQPWFAAFAGD